MAPTEDRTGQAAWAMGTGAAAAVVWFAILTYLTTRFTADSTATSIADVNPHAGYVDFLVYGAVLGVAFAAFTAWHLMAGIPSSYRRGGLSLVSAFSGAVVGGLLTVMLKELAGPAGLLLLAAVALPIVLLLARRTRRAQAAVHPE
jgi:hypothetical protein